MKNYLAKRYARYYIQTVDGQSYETSREKCFEQGETPTPENPYKQRWFYDGENYGYIIRLPRDEQGEALYRLNAAYMKNEERYRARKNACVLKGAGGCDDDCETCQKRRYPRIIELDKPLASDDEDGGEPQYFDISADEKGYAEIEENEESEALIAAAGLSEKQKRLVRLYYIEEKTVCEIAVILGISQPAVSQQLTTIKTALKKYFEKVSG